MTGRGAAKRRGWLLASLVTAALAGCASDSAGSDPLVGTWTYSGSPPDPVAITLTLNADKSFSFVEEVAPFSIPVGSVPWPGCATLETFLGTYAETVSADTKTLTWNYSGGTANSIVRCDDPSMDSAGTPLTANDVAGYVEQHMIPATTGTFKVTSTTLVLPYSLAIGGTTTFTKVR